MLRAMSAVSRAMIYVLPATCIALTAMVLLGPGSPRIALGVKVWGAPAEGGEQLALRLEGLRRLYGVDDAAQGLGIEVTATSAGAPLAGWSGSTDEDGIAEALLSAPEGLREPVIVRISRGGTMLSEQRVPLLPPAPARLIAGELPTARLQRSGLFVRVEAARGVLAAPFPETLRVTVTAEGAPLPDARIEATAAGAELEGRTDGAPAVLATDAGGAATLQVKPLAHLVELTVRAARVDSRVDLRVAGGGPASPGGDAADGLWEGRLPVIPGAIWLDPAGLAGARPELRLVSPAPSPRAYVSLEGERGRVLGAVVPLARDAAGFFAGTLPLPAQRGARYVVVASDPYEQGAGTVAWPLAATGAVAAPLRVALLADGMPAAEARERARASRARRAGLAVLGATALAEMLLILVWSRGAQRRLEAHFDAAARGGGDGAERPSGAPLSGADRARLLAAARAQPLLGVLALAALIGLSFAIVAALATFQ